MTAHFDFVVPDPPCAACYLSYFCGRERLACEAFRAYAKLERWSDAPRKPSRAIFLAVYNPKRRTVDEEALRALRERQRATHAARGTVPGRRTNQPEAAC